MNMHGQDKTANVRGGVIRKTGRYVFKDMDGNIRPLTREERVIWNDGIRFGVSIACMILGAAAMVLGLLL